MDRTEEKLRKELFAAYYAVNELKRGADDLYLADGYAIEGENTLYYWLDESTRNVLIPIFEARIQKLLTELENL